MDFKKNNNKNKGNEKDKDQGGQPYEMRTRTFNQDVTLRLNRENFSLPKIQRNGSLKYDEGREIFEGENTDDDTKLSKKKQKEVLNLKKLLENMEKYNDFNKKSNQGTKNALDEEMKRISSMMDYYKDLKSMIAAISSSIMGDPNTQVEKLELLFFIFYESLKRKREILYIKLNNNLYELRRMDAEIKHEDENVKYMNEKNQESHDEYNEEAVKKNFRYISNLNILSCISICTILKSITPSYKIIMSEEKNEENDNNDNASRGNNNMHTNNKPGNPTKNFSKLIENVNKVEKLIVKFFRRFCRLLKENISTNPIVFVNLLCELVGVNLYLSREENLLQYLIIYGNLAVYSNKKYNCNMHILGNVNEIKNKKKFKILCAKCVVTIKEIIGNDSNLLFTLNLVDNFSNILFNNEKNISLNLLKVFSNINIKEKKANARTYANDSTNIHGDNNTDLNAKMNIGGDIKVVDVHAEKILERLFVIYLCVLKEYEKHPPKILKYSLRAISRYSMYINKFIMDDILFEIKNLAAIKTVSSTIRIICIVVYLEIYNKMNDTIYVDCSWVGNIILELLDLSYIPNSTNSSSTNKGTRGNNNNGNKKSSNDSDAESFNSDLYNSMKNDAYKYSTDSDDIERRLTKGIENEKQLYHKYKYSVKIIKSVDLLLKTKSFTINYTNFKSSNSDLLYKIIYQLFNIMVHMDFEVGIFILQFINSIFSKYPLIRCICEEEGIVVSFMDEDLSVFFHNILLHSSFFKELSCEALNISMNNSNEEYKKIVEKFIKEQEDNEIEHKIIKFSLDVNDEDILNQARFMSYDPNGSIISDKKKYEENKKNVENIIKLDKKFKKVLYEHRRKPKNPVNTSSNTNDSTNNESSYELTVKDLIYVTYSKYDDLIKCFEKKHKKDATKN
ncbi:hypothetical protein CYL21_2566 [Plasmodium falciparum NF54]|uniref:Uncharacterized protein n=2 Tax=Plasmodium falciparum TaxID=5833 RepID=Q8IKG9_PLAF7|nr:conserved Plasmodium protein, unknown function [Plasmodium falciparum 3D7]EWC85309.1 hypothetical protein PFNF54_05786 [Plasmodium falciparum NF54]KAF4329386.1 hypothetical protein CYL21_2566 [Plasmodium falciparum NF54]PKC49608.1 hypothetical protein CK202_0323 [Plasmodium falciparum NF54]CZU00365.1 conserved Plasmodium protein, unknown function [Plasmodium falciparum 3D7]|eukprot:XP_001348810.1 conserved Plasmodium protein, unknown function [Plasmodium falciparum 3D7]